jgi:hypothetical protein
MNPTELRFTRPPCLCAIIIARAPLGPIPPESRPQQSLSGGVTSHLVSGLDITLRLRDSMGVKTSIVDPGVVALFGSETRAATLGVLANAGQSLSAYRIAKISGSQLIKTTTELRRLESAGFVSRAPTPRGRPGWIISDGPLRELLCRRVRIVWLADWDRQVTERTRMRTALPRLRIDLSKFPPNPRSVPNRPEFERPSGKDRALARAGLRTSRRSESKLEPANKRSG